MAVFGKQTFCPQKMSYMYHAFLTQKHFFEENFIISRGAPPFYQTHSVTVFLQPSLSPFHPFDTPATLTVQVARVATKAWVSSDASPMFAVCNFF